MPGSGTLDAVVVALPELKYRNIGVPSGLVNWYELVSSDTAPPAVVTGAEKNNWILLKKSPNCSAAAPGLPQIAPPLGPENEGLVVIADPAEVLRVAVAIPTAQVSEKRSKEPLSVPPSLNVPVTYQTTALADIGRDPSGFGFAAQVPTGRTVDAHRAALDGARDAARRGATTVILGMPADLGAAGVDAVATHIATPLREALG